MASEDIAISDPDWLDVREEFVETSVDVSGELVNAVLKFVAYGKNLQWKIDFEKINF